MVKRNDDLNEILSEVHEFCIDVQDRNIYLHGHMQNPEGDDGVEFKMANRLLKNMHFLDKEEGNIHIHMHNIGGEWESGMMIYDVIKNSKNHISLFCHGEVMSMGLTILQAADTRISMPNCHFLAHYGFSGVGEREHLSAQSCAEIEKKQTKTMIETYAEKCMGGEFFEGKTKKSVEKYLDTKFKLKGDWHMEPKDAKKYGFIDSIYGEA